MAEQLSGVISKVGDRGTSFQLEGDFSWYSAFNPEQLCGAKAGDKVSFMYATKQDKNDPEKIYKALTKHNLLTNKDWQGMGRMRVQAQINDENAIEKSMKIL